MTKNNEIAKPTKPINHKGIFETLLRSESIEKKYIKPYFRNIERFHNSEEKLGIPEFHFNLEDLQEDDLFDLFSMDIDKFLDTFRDALFDRILQEPGINEIIKGKAIEYFELLIIINPINYEFKVPKLSRFSDNWSYYINKLIRVDARYMTLGIDMTDEPYHKAITYFCNEHQTETIKKYPFGKIMPNFDTPIGCLVKKCKNRHLDPIKWDSYGIGRFDIGELKFKERQEFKECYIFRNRDYFMDLINKIRLGEEVEILGILRLDANKLGVKNERPNYYIDVMDIKPLKINRIDENIIKTLKNKIAKNPNYRESLIDSLHQLTFLMDLFFPMKSLAVLGFITGGSVRKGKRDTLNCLYGGQKSLLKSSIQEEICRKVGGIYIYRKEIPQKGLTYAGLFGTTQRDPKKHTPNIRYGIITLYSNGMMIFDEFQNLQDDLIDGVIRDKEAGHYPITQDGIDIECPDRSSLLISQNFMVNPDGSYNHSKDYDLFDNLGWKKKNVESTLDRLDLFYISPIKDIFIQTNLLLNDDREDDQEISEEIAEILELEDYTFPNDVKTIEAKIDYVHYNFLHKAREIYRISEIPKFIRKDLTDFFIKMVENSAKYNIFTGDDSFDNRAKSACKKLLRALASLRLDNQVNNYDFDFFKNNYTSYVILFRNSDFIKKEVIDINKIFRDVFETEIIEFDLENINIKDLIDRIKAYLRRNYFSDVKIEDFQKRAERLLGEEYNQSNYELKKLIKNNEVWLEMKGFQIKSKRGKGGFTIIEKKIQESQFNKEEVNISKEHLKTGDLANFLDHSSFQYQDQQKILKLYNSLKETFEINNYVSLEEKSLLSILEISSNPISKTLLKKALSYFTEIGILDKLKNGFVNFSKNWI